MTAVDQLDLLAGECRAAAWSTGDLRYKLHDGQAELYDLFFATVARRIVWHCARRFGKSWLLCVLAVVFCLRRPKSVVVYAAPSREQIKQFIWPIMEEICADAPAHLKPVYVASNHQYLFPNGSLIHLDGADDDHGDNLRGPKADLAIADEAGFWKHLVYVVRSVLGPRTLGIKHARTIIASSSPESSGHEFVGLIAEAKRRGTYWLKTIYDNPRLDAADIAQCIDDSGGVQSTVFRREFLCEIVTDETRAVVPEFDELRNVAAAERPIHLDPTECLDLGLVDFSHCLFGYLDFARAKLIIEDEIVTNYKTTGQLADLIKAKEVELWADDGKEWSPDLVHARWSDNDPQQLYDLNSIYKLPFAPATKTNRDEAINRMRLAMQQGKIEINPRCVVLIHQLKTAVWNRQRTDFDRVGEGHNDGLMALVYYVRMLNWQKNPAPVLKATRSNVASDLYLPVKQARPDHPLRGILGGRR